MRPPTAPKESGTLAPIAFVIVALAALALLPLAAERYARPLHHQLRNIAEPGRSHVTRIHVALAMEGSALHDYIKTGDSLFVMRYRAALAREQAAQRALAVLVRQMGPDVRRPHEEVRRLERAWHGRAERFLSGAGPRGDLRDPHQEDLYEGLLLAVAELDVAISEWARENRARILRAERVELWITAALVFVALIAVGAVAWLAARIRSFAADAERRRVALERAVESRARLMRGVSHDLKNPLGAIDGHAQLLEDEVRGPLSAEQKESVARMRGAVRSVLALIDDLMELSRAEAGQLRITRKPVDVGLVVREAAEEHRAAAVAAGHDFRVVIRDQLPLIVTDPDRVRQILGNLLSNAVKYTPAGGRIDVHVESLSDGPLRAGSVIAIDVADTGPGIPPEQAEAIFDEFSRLAMHSAKPGSGLGLSIARRVAHLLGGDVSLRASTGNGSTFTLWLPANDPD